MKISIIMLSSSVIIAAMFLSFGTPMSWRDGIPWYGWGVIAALLLCVFMYDHPSKRRASR